MDKESPCSDCGEPSGGHEEGLLERVELRACRSAVSLAAFGHFPEIQLFRSNLPPPGSTSPTSSSSLDRAGLLWVLDSLLEVTLLFPTKVLNYRTHFPEKVFVLDQQNLVNIPLGAKVMTE